MTLPRSHGEHYQDDADQWHVPFASYCVRCNREDWPNGDDPLAAIPLRGDGHSEHGLVCPGCLTPSEREEAGW